MVYKYIGNIVCEIRLISAPQNRSASNKFNDGIQVENEANTTIDVSQWQLIQVRGQISGENPHQICAIIKKFICQMKIE